MVVEIKYHALGTAWTLSTEDTPRLIKDDTGAAYGPDDVVVRGNPGAGLADVMDGASQVDVTAADIVRGAIGLQLPDWAYARDKSQAMNDEDEGPLTAGAKAARKHYLATVNRFLGCST